MDTRGNWVQSLGTFKDFFAVAQAGEFAGVDHDFFEAIDKAHGRLESRRYWITEELRTLPNREQWSGLRSIGLVERRCVIGKTETVEHRFFINAIPAYAPRFEHAVRGHWGVENRASLAA